MADRLRFAGLILWAACLAGGVRAAEGDAAPSKSERKTHTVKRAPFRVEVEIDGVFEAAELHPVSLRPEVWSTLKVEKAVDEGAVVEAGEPILWLDARKLDEEIRNLKFSRDLGYLSLKQAEAELHALERSAPLDLESARRARQVAAEDLEYFLNVDEEQKKRMAEEALKTSQYSLEYAQEELNQLEQMYKADDLTEQTEEIILKRARRDVERSEFFLESASLRHQRTLEFLLPREKQQVQEAAVRAELNLARLEATLPTTLQTRRIELEKLQHAQQQLEEKLALHQADRELMTVKAPAAGAVYYGESNRGKWTTASTLRQQLRPGGTVSANTVLMTIVVGGPSFVRVDVSEDKYRYFREGTKARIKPAAFPDLVLTGTCSAPGAVPVKEGTFDGRVSFEVAGSGPVPLVAMTCKVLLTPVDKPDAISVPSEAVFEDETHSGKHYVYLDDEDEPQRRPVELGEKSKGRTEILSGLMEGDVILLEKPST